MVDFAVREELVKSLGFSYQIIRASTNLLRVAIDRLPPSGLRTYYLKHLAEEESHAEWMLDDIGEEPEYQPLAAAIAGTAYYLIFHAHPAALLGYMLALETPTLTEEFLEKLEQAHGKKLLRTLRIHVTEDPKHREELLRQIALYPMHEKLIARTHDQTLLYLRSY